MVVIVVVVIVVVVIVVVVILVVVIAVTILKGGAFTPFKMQSGETETDPYCQFLDPDIFSQKLTFFNSFWIQKLMCFVRFWGRKLRKFLFNDICALRQGALWMVPTCPPVRCPKAKDGH